MRRLLRFFTDLTRTGNFNRISLFQILSQYIATIISFILILLGSYYFLASLLSYFQSKANHSEFYTLVKGLLSSFELFFMAPIPFLIIFSHRRNISQAFADILPVQNARVDLDEVKAKKGFISSIIGILSTFILGIFFEFFSKTSEKSSENQMFETHFWYCFIIISMLFLFLTILILYYKLLSNHDEKKG